MKQAKRLLAVTLAFVMIFSAASAAGYAYQDAQRDGNGNVVLNEFGYAAAPNDNYHYPHVGSDEKYYFTYDQGAAYLLDLLDELLKEGNLKMSLAELDQLVSDASKGIAGHLFTGDLNLDGRFAKYHNTDPDYLAFTSIDNIIVILHQIVEALHDQGAFTAVGAVNNLGLLGDLLASGSINNAGLDPYNLRRNGRPDKDVLEQIFFWLHNNTNFLKNLVAGTFNWGTLLAPMIKKTPLGDLELFLKNLLYQTLIDDTFPTVKFNDDATPKGEVTPENITLDQSVQKLVDWALVDGTGTTPQTGATSLLGENHQALLPYMNNCPGKAGLLALPNGIPGGADRNGDGQITGDEANAQMNFYQLIHNAIMALLNGPLHDILMDALVKGLGVEITEQYPDGDPAILNDSNFNSIPEIVVGLLVQNGAPDLRDETSPAYQAGYAHPQTPVGKIEALLDWFLNGGGLATFLKIDYLGLHIQDNFVSLLNDVARLAINLLPGLGVFVNSKGLAYTQDELNATLWYDGSYNTVAEGAEGAVDKTYIAYESGRVLYPNEKQEDSSGNTVIVSYKYLNDQTDVNVTNASGADYVNPKLIRPNYAVSVHKVYACLIKMLMNDQIEECYFPDWADDIPSVLAYGFAAMAASKIPANNYFARLDAYHDSLAGTHTPGAAPADQALPYTAQKTIVRSDATPQTLTIPKAALDIISSFGAARLNGVFQLNGLFFDTDSTFEQFAGEFLVWGAVKYLPLLTGLYDSTSKAFKGSGAWKDNFNAYINAVYTDYGARIQKAEPNFDAIYTLLDSTILKLIPESWLPGIKGSAQLINDWLLGSIQNFDLQKLLNVFAVNTDPAGELNQPTLTVLLNLIDRVLALLANDSPLLGDFSRENVLKGGNATDIHSLDALISIRVNGTKSPDAHLPQLVVHLLEALNDYKEPLFGTVLPLLVADVYERNYDEVYLGPDMARHKIADLEDYLDHLTKDVNAEYSGHTYATRVEAAAATDGRAAYTRISDTEFRVMLSDGAVYETLTTADAAQAIIRRLQNSYVVDRINEETGNEEFAVYYKKTYLDSASATQQTDDYTGTAHSYEGVSDIETHNEYTNFGFANIVKRDSPDNTTTPKTAQYGSDAFRFFEFEDSNPNHNYVYRNAKEAVDEATEFVAAYHTLPEQTLPDAYGNWLRFSIKSRLKAQNLFDANDDGQIVTDSGSADCDGDPRIPDAVYPYSTTSATNFTFHDTRLGEDITQSMNSFNGTNYEQLQMAAERGNDPLNDVELPVVDKEAAVRLAIGSINFDITPDEQGNYHSGAVQWTGLTQAQLDSITSWCNENGCTFTYPGSTRSAEETADYSIKRKAFSTEPLSFGGSIDATPQADVSAILNKQEADRTFAEKTTLKLHDAYAKYLENLYDQRRSLYNKMDYLSWRYEEADAVRNFSYDKTALQWAVDAFAPFYKDAQTNRRNLHIVGYNTVTNAAVAQKIYTASSYEKFRNAYDFAKDLCLFIGQGTNLPDITQSMVSAALYGVLKTVKELVPFLGPADWMQLERYAQAAQAIIDDATLTDPNNPNGLKDEPAGGRNALEDALNRANVYLGDKNNYDSEQQGEIDGMAALLKQALLRLQYKSNPQVVPAGADPEDPEDVEVGVAPIGGSAERIIGLINNLKEGKGLDGANDLRIVGAVDDDAGEFGCEGSQTSVPGKGNGTGARYTGTVNGEERFRYYAVLYGDLNGDARIDGSDATELSYRLAAANLDEMSDAKKEAADVDHTGVIDASDVQLIKAHYTFYTAGGDRISQGEFGPSVPSQQSPAA